MYWLFDTNTKESMQLSFQLFPSTVSCPLNPKYFISYFSLLFSAVEKVDDCIYSAIEECENELYDDPDYKYFSDSLRNATKVCEEQGNAISPVSRQNSRRQTILTD